MVRIIKKWEPKELTEFRKKGAVSYDELDSSDGVIVKEKIQQSLCAEQFGLCAYCMCTITPNTMKIEHFYPRNGANKKLDEQKSLDYSNMLAVCDGGIKFNQEHNLSNEGNLSCDASKGNKLLSLNPSVESDYNQMKIRYSSGGKIHSDSLNLIFKDEIESVLNLNVPRLITMRKVAKMRVIDYLKKNGKLTAAKKAERIKALKTPNDGLLPAFYDVSAYFLEKLA